LLSVGCSRSTKGIEEPVEVDITRARTQSVTGSDSLDHAAPECFAETTDVVEQRCIGGLRRPLPQRVDEFLDRNDAVATKQQRGQQRPLPASADPKRAAALPHLDRAKQQELHHSKLLRGL
jgi:hypothetical protein